MIGLGDSIGSSLKALGVVILVGGITFGAVGFGVGSCVANNIREGQIRKSLEVKVGDYNNNNLLDRYLENNGEKVPVEVDGVEKPIYQDINGDGIADRIYYGFKK